MQKKIRQLTPFQLLAEGFAFMFFLQWGRMLAVSPDSSTIWRKKVAVASRSQDLKKSTQTHKGLFKVQYASEHRTRERCIVSVCQNKGEEEKSSFIWGVLFPSLPIRTKKPVSTTTRPRYLTSVGLLSRSLMSLCSLVLLDFLVIKTSKGTNATNKSVRTEEDSSNHDLDF